MLRKDQIEQFYDDIKQLGLKFPVAAIAAQTGHSKANVSKYLRRKLEPSETFLNAFYEKFPKSNNNVSRETDGQELPAHELTRKYINLLEKQAGINSAELNQKLEGIMTMQIAIMETLLVLAEGSGKKDAYTKTVAILKKRKLEGIFL